MKEKNNNTAPLFILNLIFVVISSSAIAEQYYSGLPTRSQNPLLQSYFIPAIPVTSPDAWTFSQALYFTNTYQLDKSSTEELVIDVENTRFDFQLSYSKEHWHFNINGSLISNRAGYLDQTIQSWHDIFGLPQGGRDLAENDQINLFYQKDGVNIIDSQQSNEGLGDIQIAIGYQLNTSSQLWFALELPTSSSSEFISNDAIDAAIWYSSQSQSTGDLSLYGTLGLAFPANNGILENQLNNQFGFGQLGLNYALSSSYQLILQADFHSQIVDESNLDALDHSLQAQFGLRFPTLFENYQLDLFFSEDIFPGHAPDITFGLRFSPSLN